MLIEVTLLSRKCGMEAKGGTPPPRGSERGGSQTRTMIVLDPNSTSKRCSAHSTLLKEAERHASINCPPIAGEEDLLPSSLGMWETGDHLA
jgi:hypothetical protein